MSSERVEGLYKETFTVSHSAAGITSVTCTVVEGVYTVKWTVKAHGRIDLGVKQARNAALTAMDELKKAVLAEWAD